jgi:hypothetical protein
MSKKTFILSGLLLIHLHFLLIATAQYLAISRALPVEKMAAVSNLLVLGLFLSVGALLHVRFKAIGRRKRHIIWCTLFYLASLIIGGMVAVLYISAAEAVTDTHWEGVRAISQGLDVTIWMDLKFVLYLAPVSYIVSWGFFALLWFGARTPKDKQPSAAKRNVSKATRSNTPSVGKLQHG